MRRVIDPQLQFGEQDISAIAFDPKSRDDIPQILRGLQYVYITPELRARVFTILAEVIPDRVGEGVAGKADPDQGRPGMEQWKILVLGVLRLGLNADFDRIHELANQHATIRQMLGHSGWDDAPPSSSRNMYISGHSLSSAPRSVRIKSRRMGALMLLPPHTAVSLPASGAILSAVFVISVYL